MGPQHRGPALCPAAWVSRCLRQAAKGAATVRPTLLEIKENRGTPRRSEVPVLCQHVSVICSPPELSRGGCHVAGPAFDVMRLEPIVLISLFIRPLIW